MRIAITGGIGSGKSYLCRLLQQDYGIEIFNCDIVAKHIIATHAEVHQALAALIEGETAAPVLTKEALGAYIRQSPEHAARVNAIVHPRVAEAFEHSGMEWMECAILYESGFDRLVDSVVVVTCPAEERIRRIMARDHCSADTARHWLALQMSDDERIARADYHIVNDGIAPVKPQLDTLLASLR